jgi:hypothetical protein
MEEPPHRQLNYKKYDRRKYQTLAWPPNHAIIRKNIVALFQYHLVDYIRLFILCSSNHQSPTR